MTYFELDIIPVLFELNEITYHEEDFVELKNKFNKYNTFANDNDDVSSFNRWKLCYKVNDNFFLRLPINDSAYNEDNNLELSKVESSGMPEEQEAVFISEIQDREFFLIQDSIYYPKIIYELLPTEDIMDIQKISSNHTVKYSNDFKNEDCNKKFKKEDFFELVRSILSINNSGQMEYLGKNEENADFIFEMYQMLYDGNLTEINSSYDYREHPSSVGVISRVFEFNNRRLAQLEFVSYSHRSGKNIILVGQNHDIYDYLDVERLALVYDQPGSSGYGIARARERKFCLGLIHQMDPNLPKSNLLKSLVAEEYISKENDILDDEQINEDATNLLIARQEEKQKAEKEKVISNKIQDRADKLGESEMKINDVIFREDEVEYQGQTLKIRSSNRDQSTWVADTLKSLTTVYSHENINFDRVLSKFLDKVASDTDIEAIIGDVRVHRRVKTVQHKNGRQQGLHYINDERINKAEVRDCLERALCYTDDQDYTNFLAKVSKCSLKYHRYLHNGLDFRVKDPLKNTRYNIKIPLERRKNINYLDINNNLYRVSDSNKLINATGSIHLDDLRKIFTDDDIVNGVSLQDLIPILKQGKIEYEQAIEKSRELIKETEELFDLSVSTHEVNNDDKITGYKIEGNMREYIIAYDPTVDIDNQSHGVYEYPSGRYICIVDKSTDQVGYDKLVNRIYALHNDNLVASKISTLN